LFVGGGEFDVFDVVGVVVGVEYDCFWFDLFFVD